MAERWEYQVLETKVSNQWLQKKREMEIQKLRERLDALGADGWEMVGYGGGIVPASLSSFGLCFLKRRAV